MIYIIVFTISIFCMRKAFEADGLSNYRKKNMFLFISAGILILLAAFRSNTIGTDVGVYQERLFNLAKQCDSLHTYLILRVLANEPLYLVVTYFSAKLGDIFWLFFLNEFIIIVFTYLSIWSYRHKLNPDVVLAVFLFVYYCKGYNIVRQSIAIAIIMYAILLLEKKHYTKVFILEIVALGFHSSAIMGIMVFLFYLISRGVFKRVYALILGISLVGFSLFFRNIFIWIGSIFPFLPQRYFSDSYLYLEGGNNFAFSNTFYVLAALLVIIKVICINKNKDAYFLLYMMLMSFVGAIIGGMTNFAERAFLYCEIFSIFVIPQFSILFNFNYRKKNMSKYVIYCALLAYWIFDIVIKGRNDVYPYVASFLV